MTGLDNAAKLQFSRDGRFLILIHQSWGASHAKVRVWEINESLDRIPLGNALVAEACRIARQENGQAALEEGESAVFGENRRSPCQEIIETLPDPLLPHRHRRDTPWSGTSRSARNGAAARPRLSGPALPFATAEGPAAAKVAGAEKRPGVVSPMKAGHKTFFRGDRTQGSRDCRARRLRANARNAGLHRGAHRARNATNVAPLLRHPG